MILAMPRRSPLRRRTFLVAAFALVSIAAVSVGWDRDGSFAVTARTAIPERPPTFDTASAPFVIVPGGSFALGNAKNPGESHFVYVPTYFIGAFEVTNADFRRFVSDAEGYHDRVNWTEAGWRWKQGGTSQLSSWLTASAPEYARFGRDDQPVVLATWFEANAYAR